MTIKHLNLPSSTAHSHEENLVKKVVDPAVSSSVVSFTQSVF